MGGLRMTEPASFVADNTKILLMGNPNVGKSVVFSALTGINVMTANYPGTTVSFSQGSMELAGQKVDIIDVPGTYALDTGNPAERIANEFLAGYGDVVLLILDATNLERNLYLAFQILEKKLPVVIALNLMDVAQKRGLIIDVEALAEELGVPVIPTQAIYGRGIPELKAKLRENLLLKQSISAREFGPDYWHQAERIASRVVSHRHRRLTLSERLDKWMLQPGPGSLIAAFILLITFGIVVGIGMGLRKFILKPLFFFLIEPAIRSGVTALVPAGIVQNVLIGEYGFLIKSIEWPLTLVFPYVLSFYVLLGLLEDSGYMPRLATLMDTVFRRLGLQGTNIIPFLLGYGCAVPAILSTRAVGERRERIVVSTLIAIGIPCISQTGAFISLLGERSVLLIIALYAIALITMYAVGLVLNRFSVLPDRPLILELPPLLLPNAEIIAKKTLVRLRHFAQDALIPLTGAVAFTAILYETGGLAYVAKLFQPLVVGWLGLPAEASIGLIMGIVRRELAVLPLIEMNLTLSQLFVGSVVALFYLPCVGAFGVLASEFGLKVALAIGLFTIGLAFFIGGLFNHLFQLLVFLIG
ncbi:MAG: ferrous iron transporter B [Firmicutes bacterium]|nr:ferrous iron transporter B [Bacillota bacterium]